MTIILTTAAFAAALALVLGIALGFFRDVFFVPVDPLVENIREALPGANCGACGFPGCDNYAEAVAAGNAGISSCTVGGPSVAAKLGELTGQSGEGMVQIVAVLACRGSKAHAPARGVYTGLETCRGAKLSSGSTKLCSWGCLGFGDCLAVCQFDALSMDKETGLPVVDKTKCTGCRMCITECPQGLLTGVAQNQKGAMTLCGNRNPIKQGLIKTCKAACLKCGVCVKNCPKSCIKLDGNISVVDRTICDSCGTCVEKCPTKALRIIEKDVLSA